jgi:hypothetical protein|nr:hypothetical protein [uncultured Acetatifactor sp.]
MKQSLNICEYFEITPLQFWDTTENTPQLVRKALDGIKTLSDDDLIILLGLIARMNQGKWRQAPDGYCRLVFSYVSNLITASNAPG